MSLNTWKTEFYPTEADSAEAQADPVSHSLRKWQGLTTANLRKHGLVKVEDGYITEDKEDKYDYLLIDADTCALCFRYLWEGEKECEACPLALVRAGVPCDRIHDDEPAPYMEFLEHNDPQPMIRYLKKARVWERRHATRTRRSK